MIHRDRAIDLLRRANPAPPGAWLPSAEDSQRLLDVLMERSDSMETEELARVMSPPPRRPRRRRWALAAGAAAVIAAVVGAGVVLGWFEGNEQPDVVSPSPTTTVVEPTTADVPSTVAPDPGATEGSAWPTNEAFNHSWDSSIVFDERSDVVVLFGGHRETWLFEPGSEAWAIQESLAPPWSRTEASSVYHPGIDRMVLFGGGREIYSAEGLYSDLWYYDVATNAWEAVAVDGDVPEGRTNAAMVYVDSLDAVLLFGGSQGGRGGSATFADTWLFDAGTLTWTEVAGDQPPGMDMPAAMYDPNSDQVYAYGGYGLEPGEMWVFDPGTLTWDSRPLPDGWVTCYERLWRVFDPRCGLPGVYDESRGRVLSIEGDDLLTLDPVTGIVDRLATIGADLPVRDHELVHDAARDALFLFQGGDDAMGMQLWRLDLSTLSWRFIGPDEK